MMSLMNIQWRQKTLFERTCIDYISSKLRMVDIEEFHDRKESMELSVFQNLCMRHIDAAKDKLLKK